MTRVEERGLRQRGEEQGRSGRLSGLDVEAEIQAHGQWHRRLRDVIQGESRERLDVATASSDRLCGLGRWLDGAGRQMYAGQPAFAALCAVHREFHAEAGAVLAHAQASERLRAQRRLLSTFAQRSTALVAALDDLAQSPQAAGNHAEPALVWEDLTG